MKNVWKDYQAFTSKAKNQTSDAYSLHRPARKRFRTRSYRAKYTFQFVQMDLAEMQNHAKENDGMRYILTMIDVFSRFAFAIPLPNKKGDTVAEALKNVFEKWSFPKFLHSDYGLEFHNKYVKEILKGKTHLFSLNSQYKSAICERFYTYLFC